MNSKRIDQEFNLKEIDEKINHFIEETKQNELISKKLKKVGNIYLFISYTEHLLILASAITGCVFASLVCILADIASSATTPKICVITAGVKN